ncbi:MAG: polysaccharide biosynthesis C-terminal domain-containing protein [bacterium]|nr:polysaccharide biosynthesis C-terminal domain-containing protein [bacterium]
MRTKKIFLNIVCDILPYLLIGIVGLIKVKLLISCIGDIGNGYYQFINQVIAYVFLAQAGFSEAVIFKLYKPFADGKKDDINSIYSGARKIMTRIALLILVIIIVVSVFLYLFYNFEVGYRDSAILCFFVIASSYLIAYFGKTLCYGTVLAAAQDKYVYSLVLNIIKLLCDILIIGAIVIFKNLICIAIVILIVKIIEEIVMRIVVKKKYPWLKEVAKKDTSAVKMTKDLMWYQIGYLILNNVDAILLMTFVGPISVSIYTSYNFIMRFLNEITSRVYGSIIPSFGNVFVKEKEDKAYSLFNESLTLFIILGFCVTLSFVVGIRSFVKVWIADVDYLLSYVTVVLFGITLFLNILYYPLLSVITAKGLFKQNKYHIFICAGINVVLSILLIGKYQINGILLGTAIALLVNILLKSNLTVKSTFKDINIFKILSKYFIAIIVFIISVWLLSFVESLLLSVVSGLVGCVLLILLIFIVITALVFSIMYFIDSNTKELLLRIKSLIKGRRHSHGK